MNRSRLNLNPNRGISVGPGFARGWDSPVQSNANSPGMLSLKLPPVPGVPVPVASREDEGLSQLLPMWEKHSLVIITTRRRCFMLPVFRSSILFAESTVVRSSTLTHRLIVDFFGDLEAHVHLAVKNLLYAFCPVLVLCTCFF